VAAGIGLAVLAWLIPVSLKSIGPSLLRAAGEGTPSVAAVGSGLLEREKLGPAALLLTAAREGGDPRAAALGRALSARGARQPSLVTWGGWDPFLDPLFNLRQPVGVAAVSTPVLTLFLPATARATLLAYLANSGSPGVQAVLRTRATPATGRFVPATLPGGQPLDAVILLTALLYQGEHLSPALQREVRALAETAVERKELGDLEGFYLDLLSLAHRFDWAQLCELLRGTSSVQTVGEFAQLARVAPGQIPQIYAAALLSGSADGVASYLIRYGSPGAADLRLALRDGQGAVRLLLERQVPVNHAAGPVLSSAGALVLEQPHLMLAVKYLGYVLGIFLVLRGLDAWTVSPRSAAPPAAAPLARVGLLALGLAALLVVGTEPFLLRAAPPSDYQVRLRLPLLVATSSSPVASSTPPSVTMDTSTLVSIGVFAAFQVIMYLICLRKISEIDAQDIPPLLKLRLMENEENLFDSGLYVGMTGTAAALVLQVLGLIAPNLLAAYSSNLFGIICVALVKIRHVRGFRRRLILEAQAPAPAVAS
jgi:hypothetical protein